MEKVAIVTDTTACIPPEQVVRDQGLSSNLIFNNQPRNFPD